MAKRSTGIVRDGRPYRFSVDDMVIDQYGPIVGAIGIAVYITLVRHADRSAHAELSYDRIANTLAIGRSTAIRTLRKLADAGLITIEAQTDESGNPIAANIYTLCPIGEQKRESRDRGGVHSDMGGIHSDTPPIHSDMGGVSEINGGGVTAVYIGSSLSSKNHDSPPPPTPSTANGGGGDQPAEKTELYFWLLANGVDSVSAAEKVQHHDLVLVQTMYRQMVGDATGDDRGKRIGRFMRKLIDAGPIVREPRQPAPATPTSYTRPPDALDPQEAARRMVAAGPPWKQKESP